MTYIIKAQIYTPSMQDPENLESNDFWEKINLFFESSRRRKNGYQLDDFMAKSGKEDKPKRNKYLDWSGNPLVLKLEFDIQPEIFRDLERAGLKIGDVGDIEVSILAISDLGVTLSLAYYASDEEKELSMFDGSIFIPIQRLVSIENIRDDALESVYVNKAILKGYVDNVEKEE